MELFKDFISKYGIFPLWNDPGELSLIVSILIGVFLLLCNLACCVGIGVVCYHEITEIGYTQCKRMKQKRKNKILKSIPLKEKILMLEVIDKAPSKTIYMFFLLIIYYIDWLVALLCVVSFFCIIFTRGAGWSIVLIFSGLHYLALYIFITFLPHLFETVGNLLH